jgi:hypothetical protein
LSLGTGLTCWRSFHRGIDETEGQPGERFIGCRSFGKAKASDSDAFYIAGVRIRVSARERILLFCIASRALTWEKAGVLGETPIDMIEMGLIVDRPFDRLALTVRPGGGEGHAAGVVNGMAARWRPERARGELIDNVAA